MTRVKIDSLDVVFSEYIRKRAMQRVHGCERCGHWKADYKELQCAHFAGRAKLSVRYDPDNAWGFCGACHMYFGAHPLEFVEWAKIQLGGKFDLLQARSRTPARYLDKEAIKMWLNQELKNMECGL